MQGSALVHELRKVITLVDLLRDIGLDKQLSLPKVVVLGNQSSGKSSLLQQIVGLDFLPRGSGVVTRRPLELRMNNIHELKQPYAEFDQVMVGGVKKKFTNFNQVRKTIDEVTDKICGSKKVIMDIPIVLNVFSPSCPNLTIVDLPGITSIPVGQQPKNIYQITKDMALRYVKQPRSIILCVIPANQDLTTSQALKLMREIDPKGERSVGCLTKIDIMNRGDDATKILKNQQVPLRYGYVGVKNRCQQDVLNNVPVSQSLKTQRQYFLKSPIYSTLPRDCFSTESLTKKLTNILYQQIKATLPQIFQQIKHKRVVVQEQLDKLGPSIATTDSQLMNYAWKNVGNFIRIFTNSINGIKNTDYPADPISSQIREQLTNLYRQQYDQPATIDIDDKDIQKAMINFPGDSTIPGFPSIDAFLALLNPLLKKLQNPAYGVNNKIHQIMEQEATKIINEVMIKKFPQFNTKFNDLIRRVLQRHRRQLQNYLNMLLDAEISYLYTNDLTYLRGDFALTEKEKKKIQTGKIKDPLIFQLRKRIDSYFKLVVRNLRDLVPRQIFNFLIVKCLKQMQFQVFQFASDSKKLKQWFNQPEQIRNKRQQCIKAIKVFEESQKRIRMDPQISKLIRDNKREGKLYEKFGMKSPEQLAKQAQVDYIKQSEIVNKKFQNQPSKAQQINQTINKNPTTTQNSSNNQNQQQVNQNKPVIQNTNQNGPTIKTQANTQPINKNTVTPPSNQPSKISLFNMFGTNVQTQPQQSQPNTQNNNVSKPNNLNNPTNPTNPISGMSSPTAKDNNSFSDFWNKPSSNNVNNGNINNANTNKVNPPPVSPSSTSPVKVNQPIQPLLSPTNNKAPQPNPITNPTAQNQPTNLPKPSQPKKTTAFNQLFGLGSKPS